MTLATRLPGRSALTAPMAVLLVVLAVLAPAGQGQEWPPDAFVDDDGNVHEQAINIVANIGITVGCNPPDGDEFCPGDSVSRGQMAAFIRRALDLPVPATDYFTDDDNSVFENDINAIAEAGITAGCTANDFCPYGTVTRGQMAAFLRRAVGLPLVTTDYFTDDGASPFENDINAIAEAGITAGCNPPDGDRFCPTNLVTRAQMATFLVRAFELEALPPDPALDFVLAFSGICDTDQVACEDTIFFPAATPWPIDEGWFYELPYAPGEEEQFLSGQTAFRVRVDGAQVPMTAEAVETQGNTMIRRFTGTLPNLSPGEHTVIGEWWWDGVVVYTTELTVIVP